MNNGGYLSWRDQSLSCLALGTAQLGMEYGIANVSGQPIGDRADRIVEAALAAGINLFDTAQGYGESESILGTALSRFDSANRALVVTKIAPELKGAPYEHIREAIKKSLSRLGLESFFGILLHREDWLDDWHGLYGPVLRRLKADGLTRYGGVSVYADHAVERALEISEIDLIQVPFNVFDQRALMNRWFSGARDFGKLLILRSIFLQGLLLLEPDELPPHMFFARAYLERFHRCCIRAELSPKDACIGFAMTQASSAVSLFGAERPVQVEETTLIAKRWAGRRFPVEIFTELAEDVEPHLINPSLWAGG